MSTTADIFGDLNGLLISVDELLQTSTAREAPNIASDLGAETQLNDALDFFIDALNQLAGKVDKLRDPLLQADTVVAGFEIIAGSLSDLGEGQAFLELTKFFELPDAPFQSFLDGIHKSGVYLKAGLGLSDNLPAPEDLRDTIRRLKSLGGSLEELKAKPALPPSTQTALTNATTGGNSS